MMPAEGKENPLLKKGNSDAFFKEKYLTKNTCLGLLKLADKYSAQRLENACKRALEFTPRPSLKNIQAILASGQDKLPTEPEPTSSSQYGFTRGADYYDRGKKKC